MNKKNKNRATPVQIHNHVGNGAGLFEQLDPKDFKNFYNPTPLHFGIEGHKMFHEACKSYMTESFNQNKFDTVRQDLPKLLRFKYQRDKGQRYLVSRSFHNDQVYKIFYDEKKKLYSSEFTLLINNKLFMTTSNLEEITNYINEIYNKQII